MSVKLSLIKEKTLCSVGLILYGSLRERMADKPRFTQVVSPGVLLVQ